MVSNWVIFGAYTLVFLGIGIFALAIRGVVAFIEACDHKWKIIENFSVKENNDAGTINVAAVRVLQCERCGNLKNHRIR